VNDEIVGGAEVDYDVSGPVRPFLVIQAVCARGGFEIQQASGSVRVRQMVHRWRGDIVAKWCHTVLRLQGQVYAHMQAVKRMTAGNPPHDRDVVARTRWVLLVPSFAKQVTGELRSRYDSHFYYSSGCRNGNSDASGDGGGYDNRWSENDGHVPLVRGDRMTTY